MSWIITPVFLLLFGGILVGFHVPIMIARALGYRPGVFMFNMLNYAIMAALRVVGTRFDVRGKEHLPPPGTQIILVSNHQSMYDIPLLVSNAPSYHLKFVTKKELGRWVPSISYCLRSMGSVLIDRKNPRQAVPAIEQWTDELNARGWSAVIFPEGTRARLGVMRAFRPSGLVKLLERMPHARIVPAAIEHSWELLRHNLMPLPFGVRVRLTFLPTVVRSGSPAEIAAECERRIRAVVHPGGTPAPEAAKTAGDED